MPVLEYHLVDGECTAAQHEVLLRRSAALYAEVLRSPMDRVRVFITLHPPALWFAAGETAAVERSPAPYFSFIVLEGRPVEECQRLLSGFTDLLVEIVGAPRDRIRGGCWPVRPEHWAVGGVPASVLRAEEIRKRAEAGLPS